MKKFEIKISMDGRNISVSEVRKVEAERARIALNDLSSAGAELTFNGSVLNPNKINELSNEEVVKANIEIRENLGQDGILEVFKNVLAESDKSWRNISENSKKYENFQKCFVEIEVKGVTVEQFLMFNHKLNTTNDLKLAASIHPEHYVFKAVDKGQYVLETLGQYKPTYMLLSMANSDYRPVELDADTKVAMSCEFSLMSDGTPMKMVAMHQFKERENGLGVKLGIFIPEAAPAEIAEGHKWHFAIEFLNVLNACYESYK